MTELFPFLAVRDVPRAVEFYANAFGAVETRRDEASGDAVVSLLEIDDRTFGLATERPDLDTPSPETAGATTVRIFLQVDDPDAVQARAIAAGATEMFPVADQPYGMRQGRVVDPFGHHSLILKPL